MPTMLVMEKGALRAPIQSRFLFRVGPKQVAALRAAISIQVQSLVDLNKSEPLRGSSFIPRQSLSLSKHELVLLRST